jgi:anionic cell wall polymer biosynthesis LytR-Cps2A-Psr (LCP) family protein
MTDIDLINEDGDIAGSLYGQIALQYAAGTGGAVSNFAMRRTVSRLLHNLPIHGLISLNIDAVQTLNDAIEGVTITMPEDYTHIDPTFVEGATITLTGRQVERFVQFRDITVDGDNLDRMNRQVLFLTALLERLRQITDNNPESYVELFELLEPFMVTDLRIVDIPRFMTYEFDSEDVAFLPGIQTRGERYAEFHVDESALKELLINTFYLPMR